MRFFIKLNLLILLVLVGQQERSQKYVDLSAFNKNLNDSNPCSSLSVMSFRKWELFSGSPGMYALSLCKLWKTLSFVLCLNELILILDFKS